MNWSPFWISLSAAIPATIITFLLGIYAAEKVVHRDSLAAKMVDVLFTLPLVLPPTVAGFLLLMLFGKSSILGRQLMDFGIRIIFTRSAIILAAIVISFPLMYRSAKSAFEQVDQNIIYAGKTLGLSEVTIFWRIKMPMAFPGVASGGILAFARALGEFGATLMIAGNIPNKTQTMPVAVYMAIQEGRYEEAVVWVGILFLLSFLMISLMNLFQMKNIR